MSVGLAIIRILLGLYLTAHGLQKATPRLGFGGIAGAAQDFASSGVRGGRARNRSHARRLRWLFLGQHSPFGFVICR